MICPAQIKRTSKAEDLVTEILRATTAKAVTVEWVNSLEEETRWNELIRKHHYLKEHRMVGESLRYVIKQNGDSSPSEADIKVTRDLIRAGQLLKIEVLDHVVIGQPDGDSQKGCLSLRELGYFYS